ncbi:MAG: PQQ-binding-like beta-propeller repeat protein [Planctomycetota bacterium]
MKNRLSVVVLVVACLWTLQVRAGDWPQFRYDVGRTAAAPHALSAELELHWTRELPPPRPAFPREPRLAYDACYEPVVLGRAMFVPSMVDDSVTALDTETGEERWRFFAEGPVRFAPVAWQDKVYFVSDDGYLYCVAARDGRLLWKFRGLPAEKSDRKVIGHGRLISLFPARGGPVLADGIVYFAAGLWPSEGVYVHAVDAESGEAVWSNTDSDVIPKSNWDHGIAHVSGLSPQGYLAIIGERLVVPCGTQLPAFLDLETGELQDYTMGWGGRNGLPKGCWFVAGASHYLSHSGDLYDLSRHSEERFADTKPGQDDYKSNLYPGGWDRLDIERANQRELDAFRQPVMTPEVMYESDQSIVARDLTEVTRRDISKEELPAHRSEDTFPDTSGGTFRKLWELPLKLDLHIKAGDRLYVGGPGVVKVLDTADRNPEVIWQAQFDGTPQRMLAADGKLFIVTAEGRILAFGAPQPGQAKTHPMASPPVPATDPWTERAAAILEATDVSEGYALVLGVEQGRLIEELVRQSKLHVIAVDDNPDQIATVRRRLHAQGVYGTRASALVGDPLSCPFSPYLASLVVTETPADVEQTEEAALVQSVFHTLRPYGGVACAWGSLADRGRIEELVRGDACPGAVVRKSGDFVMLTRPGPLPGAADWSHAEANAASTGASEDEFIRSPMSVLWFDASHRWHKFPGQEQVRVAGGRLVLLEEGVLTAVDVYTGRELWKVDVPVGKKPLDDPRARQSVRYQRHRQWGPPASVASSTQLVVLEDAIYFSKGTRCWVFDPATGKSTGRIELPEGVDAPWVNLRVHEEYLVGSSGPHVLCMDRRSGEILWQVEAARPALSLALGGGKVYCGELVDPRRGEDESDDGSLFALDIATGEQVWQRTGGSRLRYSPEFDLVVTPRGFYRARNGEPVAPKSEPPRNGFVVTGGRLPERGVPGYVADTRLLTGDEETLVMYDLPSGKRLGEPTQWVRRGCTGTRASTNLLTTRYRGNSAWIDLASREITPLLGIRPACSVNNNLYPANGVLNMPNLTAGCTCNYLPVSTACVPASVVKRGPGK